MALQAHPYGFASGVPESGAERKIKELPNKARHINRRDRFVLVVCFHIFSLECYRGRAPAPSVCALYRSLQKMTTMTTLAGLLAICIFANAGEIVIASFDGEKESVQRMSEIIRRAAVGGATFVRFPDGQWKWHDLGRLGLPQKPDLVRKEYEIGAPEMEKNVREWIAKHNVKAVQIAIAKEAPANVFFKIERLLTGLNIPYGLVSGAEVARGKLLLLETNGVARVIPLQEPKSEQGVPPNGP